MDGVRLRSLLLGYIYKASYRRVRKEDFHLVRAFCVPDIETSQI